MVSFYLIAVLLTVTKGYVVEVDSTYEKYWESGISERIEYRRIKILSPKGVSELKSVSTSYTPYYNTASFDFIVIKRKGQIIEVDTTKAIDVPAPPELGGTIFWGTREKLVELGDLKPGDVVEYRIRKFGGNWLGPTGEEKFKTPYPGYFNTIELFGGYEEINRKVYVVEELPEKPIKFGIFNGKVRYKKILNKGKVLHKFWLEKIKPIKSEPFAPSLYDRVPKVIVTNIPSWREMSKMEYQRSMPNILPDSFVKRVSDSLCAGLTSDDEKIKRLFYFVADEIRYLGLIESQFEGYEPHKASITLLKRSGVCKDKAALLASLLIAQGFKAYYATTAVGMKMEDIPLDQTNHAIVALELNPYEYIYLDPTVGAGGRELLPPSEWEQGVLVSREEGDTLRIIPGLGKEYNLLIIAVVEKVNNDTLKFMLNLKAQGAWDQNFRSWARGGREAFKRRFESMLRNVYVGNLVLDSLRYPDPYDYSDYFTVSLCGYVPNYLFDAKATKLFKPSLLRIPYSFIFYLTQFSEDRNQDLVLRFPFMLEVEESILFSGKIGFEPQKFNVEEPGKYVVKFSFDKSEEGLKGHLVLGFEKKRYEAQEVRALGKAIKSLNYLRESWVTLED